MTPSRAASVGSAPPATASTSTVPQATRTFVSFAWRHPSTWVEGSSRLWRRSLRFRTVLITLALTALAILIACVWMALAIQNDLFQSRRDEVLDDSRRAAVAAQATLDSAAVQGDRVRLQNLMRGVGDDIARRSSSDEIAVFRVDSAPSSIAPQDFTAGGFDEMIVSEGLRERVQAQPTSQWWQSVSLEDENGRTVVDGAVLAAFAVQHAASAATDTTGVTRSARNHSSSRSPKRRSAMRLSRRPRCSAASSTVSACR